MGVYLDLLQNMSIEPFNFSETFTNDLITPAIDSGNDFTRGWLGIGVLIPIWFGLYQHISDKTNQFELSQLQAIISVNAIIFTIALMLVHIGVLTSSQHFVWVASLVFIANVIGVLRSN